MSAEAKKEVLIKVTDLKKHYNNGAVKALDGINAEIYRGEVVVIIGPSGSGKSTFLRSLNLLELPTSGKIELDGIDITDKKININKYRQKMGMVFQHFNLFPNMTVLRNMTIAPTKLLKKSPAEANAKAEELLKRVGLADRAGAYPSQLSGGQKQRIAIVRALCMEPEVMHFDELCLRPGNGRRGFGCNERIGRRRHDDDLRYPRNGLCPRGRRPRHLYGRRRHHRARHT
mgnify:CR=1 FL=1